MKEQETNNQTLDDRLMIGHRFSKSAITSEPAYFKKDQHSRPLQAV
jgi:hypothetical protein